ncbi:hypothetical protein D3C86_1858650 [compost metagenome]
MCQNGIGHLRFDSVTRFHDNILQSAWGYLNTSLFFIVFKKGFPFGNVDRKFLFAEAVK